MMRQARTAARTAALAFAAAFGLMALSGCDEEEQNRILLFEKGTYLGPSDDSMGETNAEQLRQRAKHQGAL